MNTILKTYRNLAMTITPEIIGYLAATLTTSSFLPQAILTVKTRDTASLSLTMYSLFTSGVLCWLIYGLYLSDKAIIFANAITFLLAAPILSFKIYHTLCGKR
jgi:MtN3 and saliva related transmembrane protein